MDKLISVFWIFLEILAGHLFVSSFLPCRVDKKRMLLAYLALGSCVILTGRLLPDAIPRPLISGCLWLLTHLYVFQGSFLQRLSLSALYYLMLCAADTIFLYGLCSLLSISLAELLTRKLMYLTVGTIGKLANILIAWLLHSFRKAGRPQELRPQWLLLSMLFPAVSFIMLYVVFESFQGSTDLSTGAFLFSMAVSVADLAIVYLIGLLEKHTRTQYEMELLNQQMAIQAQSILTLEKSYRAQRTAAHEFSHRMQTLDDLLTQGEYDEAKRYVKQLQGMQTTRVFGINAHHPIIDAILNSKYQAARELGIDMQVHVNDLCAVSLPTDALVVLLANLLDNAIEACQRYSGNGVIHCTLLAEDALFLSIENTSEPVKIEDGKIPTSKSTPGEHGYGLPNAQRILRSLGAEFTFHYANGWFRFAAEIPM